MPWQVGWQEGGTLSFTPILFVDSPGGRDVGLCLHPLPYFTDGKIEITQKKIKVLGRKGKWQVYVGGVCVWGGQIGGSERLWLPC